MTEQTTEQAALLTVTQADNAFAARWAGSPEERRLIAQDAARHRIAAQQPQPNPGLEAHMCGEGKDLIGQAEGICTIPPVGWWCSRAPGHDGPCAARPMEEPFDGPLTADEQAKIDSAWERHKAARPEQLGEGKVAGGEWRYAINYGPDGEANYANVYDEQGALVGNLRVHHAIAVVSALTPPPDSVDEYSDERFLVAYVSQDAKVIGIEHDTEADWVAVHRAHVVLRDRLNERLAEREKCPFRPPAKADLVEALAKARAVLVDHRALNTARAVAIIDNALASQRGEAEDGAAVNAGFAAKGEQAMPA